MKEAEKITDAIEQKIHYPKNKDYKNLACLAATIEEFLYAAERLKGELGRKAQQMKKGERDTAQDVLSELVEMFSHLQWHCEEAWKAALDLSARFPSHKRGKQK